mgnify:CR=1 FL=1
MRIIPIESKSITPIEYSHIHDSKILFTKYRENFDFGLTVNQYYFNKDPKDKQTNFNTQYTLTNLYPLSTITELNIPHTDTSIKSFSTTIQHGGRYLKTDFSDLDSITSTFVASTDFSNLSSQFFFTFTVSSLSAITSNNTDPGEHTISISQEYNSITYYLSAPNIQDTPARWTSAGPSYFRFYLDNDIDSKTGAYNYRINLIDSCGNIGEISNVATTIFLNVTTQDVEMKTTLSWTDYFGFDGNILEYRIYRGINGVFEIAPVAILSSNIRSFVDDVSDFYESEGQFCYRIEAIESVNSYGINRTAFSNAVCVTIEPIVYIPNAFTINGYNPVFIPIISLYDFESYDLQIYNRWGEIVFNTIDRDLGWNGVGNDGDLKSEAVYVYLLRFKDEFGKEYEFKGSLTMLYSNTD